MATTDALGRDLKAERDKSSSLLDNLREEQSKHDINSELQMIVDDLQREKKMMQEELDMLVANKFTTSRDDEFQLQISALKKRMAELQEMSASSIDEKMKHHTAIKDLKGIYN